MNKSYTKGRRIEYLAKKILENEGYQVFRSAGSKGPWDLIALKDHDIRFIQVKSRPPYGKAKEKFTPPQYHTFYSRKEYWVHVKGSQFDIIRVK